MRKEYGFENIPFDGVLGLNYPNISFSGAVPIFDKLKNEGAILEPVFAFYFSKDEQEGSVVMFGGVDHRYYEGELNWVPLTKAGDWIVRLDRAYDGILGLNYPNKSFSGAIPIFDKLKNQGAIAEPAFAFYLSKDEREGSVVMFGGVDHRYYKGELNWIPLIKADNWIVHMDRVVEYGFEGRAYDGILGLNYPNESFSGAIPIFDKLKNQGAISEPVFAFYLSKDGQEGSVVMFGGVDHRYYKGELNWVPLVKAGDWIVHMDSISMRRKVIACSGGCEAVVDTGVSMIKGPGILVDNIQKHIGARPWGSKHYVSCSAVNTLPSIIFTINGVNYQVPARAYILKDSRGYCYTIFEKITVSPSTETWILGNIFLRLYFSVFDRANDRIGLARAV
ncbi:hypothetical protein MG293_019838 [Ovis ammon polii]|uniref:Peptidase A1 domain-containing protein n=1 Tax=Ovis ammon polii TaxID=230172 RepID=A0AAD4TKY4_OVIAM|nr:hypothetical protein MG293_019838 [Ovis ammon polii]